MEKTIVSDIVDLMFIKIKQTKMSDMFLFKRACEHGRFIIWQYAQQKNSVIHITFNFHLPMQQLTYAVK